MKPCTENAPCWPCEVLPWVAFGAVGILMLSFFLPWRTLAFKLGYYGPWAVLKDFVSPLRSKWYIALILLGVAAAFYWNHS